MRSRSASSGRLHALEPSKVTPVDELGAHVSTAGGLHLAPGRAAELDAVVLQLFTKQPSRWAEPRIALDVARAWGEARVNNRIRHAAAHDSYLINLATPDSILLERSRAAFQLELRRCADLGIDFLVTHPGNATDEDRARGLAQNSDAVAAALDQVPAPVSVLFETTAGSGSALGATFEELAELIHGVPAPLRDRVGVCLDTCHLYAAGYDLARDYDGVIARLDDAIGLERVRLFHLNDSATPFASRRDRHAHIGEGSLGEGPFRRLLDDARFFEVPKVLETPKDGDTLLHDRRNLARLRGYRAAGLGGSKEKGSIS